MKKYNLMFTLLFIIVTAAFSALIFNNNVWYDEAYTLAMIEHGFGEISKITAADVHPPLYYWMLKIFMIPFGNALVWTKVFSIIPMCLTMLLGYVKLGKIINKRTGLLFALFFSLMPLFTIYAVQVRMYSWCIFFVFACGIYAYLAHTQNKTLHWILFMLNGVLAAYTHYFALVSVGVIYGFLFFASFKKKHIKRFILFSAITVLLYLPWLTSFISQLADKVENEYWIAPITLSTIGDYFKTWYKCGDYWNLYLTGSVIIYIISIFGLLGAKKPFPKKAVLLGVLVFVFTNLIGIGASLAVRPVYIERYAIGAVPFLSLFAACGIGSINKKSLTAITSIFFILGFLLNYPDDYKFEYNETDSKTGEYITSNNFDALICYVDSHLYGVLSYYAPEIPVYRPKTSQGSPFKNIAPLSEFNPENCKKAALFIPDGAVVPEEALSGFISAEYDCDVITYGQKSNVFVLER